MTEPTVFDADEHTATEVTVNQAWLAGYDQAMAVARGSVLELVASASKLVELLNESECQHGGLLTTNMLNAKNQLALELSRWK